MENILERAVILSAGKTLEIEDEIFVRGTAPSATPNAAVGLEELEREHILSILKQTNWIIEGPTGAATILKIHPNTLRSRLKKMGISKATYEVS
jgi:transcriptional regulator with GAF, ATPase, and Fis domain